MANSNPPDKINDRESPTDRNVDAPYANTLGKEPGRAQQHSLHEHEADKKAEDPTNRDWALEHNPADLVVDRGEAVPGRKDRRFILALFDFCCSHHGLLTRCVMTAFRVQDLDFGFPLNKWCGAVCSNPATVRNSADSL